MKVLGYLILDTLVYGAPLMLMVLHLLHFILPKKFDDIWFNDKFFSSNELTLYSSYPLSLVRTIGYASAICLPFMMKKRFGDLQPAQDSSITIKIPVFIWLLSLTLVLIAGIAAMGAALVLD